MTRKTPAPHGKKALVIGRFQPPHKGHVQAMVRILKKHKKLLILIGSAQYRRTANNPFSTTERKEMLRASLREEGVLKKVEMGELEDVHDNVKWEIRVLKKAKGVQAVYTNNSLVRRLLKKHFRVKRMVSSVRVSSTKIRQMMRQGNPRWRKFVPKTVRTYLERKIRLGVLNSR